MTGALAVLCYHRVVESAHEGWPYLDRGTAVHAETLERQVEEIREVADILTEPEALDVLAGARSLSRPAVWLTFDDAYSEVRSLVAPMLERIGACGTVFVTTGTLAPTSDWLPADHWYALLLVASRRRGIVDLGMGPFEFDLDHREGRARLVHGVERRRYLRSAPAAQRQVLAALADALAATAAELRWPYLSSNDLTELASRGWGLGSHGVTHTPFDVLEDREITLELERSRSVLNELAGQTIASLALPDGRLPVERSTSWTGFRSVLGLGDALARPGSFDVVPRFLVPDDPCWVTNTLRPAFGAA